MSAKNEKKQTKTDDRNETPYSFEPFNALSPMIQDGFDRTLSLFDELATIERENYERVRKATEHFSSMVTDTILYSTELVQELRKISLEATRKGGELFSR